MVLKNRHQLALSGIADDDIYGTGPLPVLALRGGSQYKLGECLQNQGRFSRLFSGVQDMLDRLDP